MKKELKNAYYRNNPEAYEVYKEKEKLKRREEREELKELRVLKEAGLIIKKE